MNIEYNRSGKFAEINIVFNRKLMKISQEF